MKVTTDACLFGAWVARIVEIRQALSLREGKAYRVLEIGTGTGLLTLMFAQKVNASIDTIEIDKDAYEQARENISASPWKERIEIHHADARKFKPSFKYDIIISNPPFYENELKSPDEKKNVAHHGGLRLVDLLDIIFYNLDTDGRFYLLLPAKRTIEAGILLAKYEFEVTESVLVRQSTQHDHFRMFIEGRRVQNEESKLKKNEISIWDDKKEYTKEFTDLLKDYYLNL